VRADGTTRELPSKVPHTAVRAGDRFVCAGPAGGGYGDPFTRPPERVLADVLDGLISPEIAHRDFGVAIANDALDVAATSRLRANR
jgi:N-methylhydantoinase B